MKECLFDKSELLNLIDSYGFYRAMAASYEAMELDSSEYKDLERNAFKQIMDILWSVEK